MQVKEKMIQQMLNRNDELKYFYKNRFLLET